ncbi:uncharacterized protein GGS22DRAFT_187206 [Annulohypoxylon maeteangense]|uniref:uncharacterized protein n=1 Tax=Annulohypoxylon maeteangense TaxID=1927788 RepID=UPI002007C840|nr:uncharacterized protein GGS22DRAFT_187206 [Annulohypoxylon maeteangense]KAI0885975.1 hypothetical protein GGS22DRAFT_187206 [Annulohypoxylon maeteangense]
MDKSSANTTNPSKAKETEPTARDQPSKDNSLPIDRYLNEDNRYEKLAVGEPSSKRDAEEKLRAFDKMWEAAGGQKS